MAVSIIILSTLKVADNLSILQGAHFSTLAASQPINFNLFYTILKKIFKAL